MFVKEFTTTNLSEDEKLVLEKMESLNGEALNGAKLNGGGGLNGATHNGATHLPKLVMPSGETFEIPMQVFQAFQQLISHLIQGKAYSVIPSDCLLDEGDATKYLGAASRSAVPRLLEAGELPFVEGEAGRLIRFGDLLQYEERMHQKQLEFIEWMAQVSQEAGEY